jgi:hypothetical protein
MYIVAIAWVYVVGMMALGSRSLAQGFAIALVIGAGPLVVLAGLGSLRRRRSRPSSVADEGRHQGNGSNAQSDQPDLLHGGAQVHPLVEAGDQIGDRDVDHARGDESQQ